MDTIRGRVFLNVTYERELIAAAGVPLYSVHEGKEAYVELRPGRLNK